MIRRLRFRINDGIFFRYKYQENNFTNEHDGCKNYHIKHAWEVSIRLNLKSFPKFEAHTFTYDGIISESFTFLGLEFGKHYYYDSRPLLKWPVNELVNW